MMMQLKIRNKLPFIFPCIHIQHFYLSRLSYSYALYRVYKKCGYSYFHLHAYLYLNFSTYLPHLRLIHLCRRVFFA